MVTLVEYLNKTIVAHTDKHKDYTSQEQLETYDNNSEHQIRLRNWSSFYFMLKFRVKRSYNIMIEF
jgi:hypothetical protein